MYGVNHHGGRAAGRACAVFARRTRRTVEWVRARRGRGNYQRGENEQVDLHGEEVRGREV